MFYNVLGILQLIILNMHACNYNSTALKEHQKPKYVDDAL